MRCSGLVEVEFAITASMCLIATFAAPWASWTIECAIRVRLVLLAAQAAVSVQGGINSFDLAWLETGCEIVSSIF